MTASATEQRRAQAAHALERELERLVRSGDYAAWFRAMSRLHRYSPSNAMWILAQRPDATVPASYRTWEQLGRHVRKGERGILVWHPKTVWVDPGTGERVRPPHTSADRSRLEQRVSFGVGYVFDVSQTDGEPLPELVKPAPEEAPQALTEHLDGYCQQHGIQVDTEQLRPGLYGYYLREDDRLVLNAANGAGERVATIAHELAHREDPELVAAHAAGDRRYYAHNRPDCEAVAEAAAHTLSARFGLDLTGHSAGYIASWVKGDVDRFRQLHDRVGQVTRLLVPPHQLDLALDAARGRAGAASTERSHERPSTRSRQRVR